MSETVHLNYAVGEGAAKLRDLRHRLNEGTAGTVILIREWITMAADYADTLYDTYTTQVVNPQADGQTYAGTWKVLENRIEGDDTRAVTIVQTLAIADTNGLTSTFMENCDTQVTIKRYFNQTKAQYDTVVSAYATSTTGRTVSISAPSTNEIGGLDFAVTLQEKQVRKYFDIVAADATLAKATKSIEIGLASGFGSYHGQAAVAGGAYRTEVSINPDCTRNAETTYLGAKTDAVTFRSVRSAFREGTEVSYRNSFAVPTAPASVTGSGIYRADVTENTDGTYDGRLSYEVGTNNGQYDFNSLRTAFRAGHAWVYRELTNGIAVPDSVTGSGIYRADNTLNENGTYSGTLTYEYGTNTGVYDFDSLRSLLKSGHTWLYESLTRGVHAPAAGGGGVYRADNTLNPDGTYSGRLVYEYGANTGAYDFDSLRAHARAAHSWVYENLTTGIAAPAASGGGIYRAENSLNADGTYSGRLVYEYGTGLGTYSFDSLTSFARAGRTWVYDGLRQGIAAPVAGAGGLYRADNTLNADGTYSGRLSYEYTTNAGVYDFDSLRSLLKAGHTWVYDSVANGVKAPASAGGGIYRADNTLNPDGTYSGRLVYEYGTDSGVYDFDSLRSQARAAHSWVYENLTTGIVAPAATGGGIYRADNTLNSDGTYSGRLVYEYGTGLGSYSFDSLASVAKAGRTWVYDGLREGIAAPASGAGGIYRAENSLNTDGTYSGRLVYEYGTNAGVYQFDSLTSNGRAARTWVYDNLRYGIAAPANTGTGVYRAENTLSADGTYSGRLVYEYGLGNAVYEFDSLQTPRLHGHTWIYDSRLTGVAAPAATAGGIYRAENTLNSDGTYSGRIAYEYSSGGDTYAWQSLRTQLANAYSVRGADMVAPLAIGETTPGYAYLATHTFNANGTYDSDVTYNQAVPDRARTTARINSEFTGIRDVYQNYAAISEASVTAVVGYEYGFELTRQNDGSYNATATVGVFKPVDTGWFASAYSPTSDYQYARSFRNLSTLPHWTTAGSYGSTAYTVNQAGLYDGQSTYDVERDVYTDTNDPFWGSKSNLYDYQIEERWVDKPGLNDPLNGMIYWRKKLEVFDLRHSRSSVRAHEFVGSGLTGSTITEKSFNGHPLFVMKRVKLIYWDQAWNADATPAAAP